MTTSHEGPDSRGAGGPDKADEGPTRRLERPPGERYAGGAIAAKPAADDVGGRGPAPGRGRAMAVAAVVAMVTAFAIAAAGLLDVSLGLIGVAIVGGWASGVAVRWGAAAAPAPVSRGHRAGIAAGAALLGVAAGLLVVWGWSLGEGGVLDPVTYLVERFGPVAAVMLAVAPVVAALRAR